jgi:hypothetical protein
MEGSLVAYKVFTNGSVLNASEINDNLMNQSVMVFSNSTARSAALTSPVEGMLTWLEDSNKYQNYNGSAWVDFGGGGAILQVLSTLKTDTFTTSSASFVDVTGLSVTITPTSATNKILVMVNGYLGSTSGSASVRSQILRGATAINIGDAAGSRTRSSSDGISASSNHQTPMALSILDSPATTSATTYKVQLSSNSGGNNVFLNRSSGDSDAAFISRTASSITVMEVVA